MKNVSFNTPSSVGFHGLTVAALESRMSTETENLILRHGGKPLIVPSVQSIPLIENNEIFDFFYQLQKKHFHLVIFMTGLGTSLILKALETQFSKNEIYEAFQSVSILLRGPKIMKSLTAFNLKPTWIAPEPHTWKEMLDLLKHSFTLKNTRVAIQEYGSTNIPFLQHLIHDGAKEVSAISSYQWALPQDLLPLQNLILNIMQNQVQVILFTSSIQVEHLFKTAEHLGQNDILKTALKKMIVGSIGPVTTQALVDYGLVPDLSPEHPQLGHLIKDLATQSATLLSQKHNLAIIHLEPIAPDPVIPISHEDNLFLKACRREPVTRPPIWLMRQAGRYLASYQKIRSQISFLDLCKNPDLAAEITLQPINTLHVDAAILFSDLLIIAEPLGFDLEYTQDHGPRIANPLQTALDFKRMTPVPVEEKLTFVFETIQKILPTLNSKIPLIGFAGAPFTLASYLIEGGASKNYIATKTWMHNEPLLWNHLMEILVDATARYLTTQIKVGVQAIQIFDTWVGCLSPDQFKMHVLPHLKSLIQRLPASVPTIYFGTQTTSLLPYFKTLGASVIGLDWRVDLETAQKILAPLAIQGNFDPSILFCHPSVVQQTTQTILEKMGNYPGFIFNLGHGILPNTPLENVKRMIHLVQNFNVASLISS